jgi:hypothetical protein
VPAKSDQRIYTVCEVQATSGSGPALLLVVGPAVRARNAEHACEVYVEGLPPEERTGEFGAFLASSWHQFGFQAEPTVSIRKTARERPFGASARRVELPAGEPESSGEAQHA